MNNSSRAFYRYPRLCVCVCVEISTAVSVRSRRQMVAAQNLISRPMEKDDADDELWIRENDAFRRCGAEKRYRL